MNKDILYFIGLLYSDTDADTVDARFDENLLILISCNSEGVQEYFRGGCGFDFRDIVSFCGLGCEV
jgi:hypothetical protein